MIADWLIEHVGPLRRAAAKRERRIAGLMSDAMDDAGVTLGEVSAAVRTLTAPPSAGIDEPDRRAKHAARLAEAMEKDAAAKYRRLP